jgi:hypothetical protein
MKLPDEVAGAGFLLSSDFRLKKKINGSNDTLPRANLTPLKVKGPTCSIPARWATKEKPQMMAASNRMNSDLCSRAFNFNKMFLQRLEKKLHNEQKPVRLSSTSWLSPSSLNEILAIFLGQTSWKDSNRFLGYLE